MKKNVLVVGGGWGAFGAAYAAAQAGAEVVVLDAVENPGGLASGWRTPGGRFVEAGIKGFWWQYHNIFKLADDLGIKDTAFTDWTRSTIYTPDGIMAESPIFSALPRLPTPLGSFVYTEPYFTSLPIIERLSAVPLIQPLVEYNVDEQAYEKYDNMSLKEMCESWGMSDALYEFLEDMLLVILFLPAGELSAAASLDALYYFVLGHQPDFDVRWCRGSIAETIFKPFIERLESMGAVVLGGRRVQQVERTAEGGFRVIATTKGGEEEAWTADAIAFGVGVNAMQGIVANSPSLSSSPQLSRVSELGTLDASAIRLWLDRKVPMRTPSNVLAGFESDVGGTFFDLCALQADEYGREPGSVVEVDLYHSDPLAELTDEELLDKVVNEYLAGAVPDFKGAGVLDYSVLRFKGAVTAFRPGSAAAMPPIVTDVEGVFMSGDWVAQGPGSHGARGLSQEKAYVSGLTAGNAAAELLGLEPKVEVIPVEEDEPHIAAARTAAKEGRAVLRSVLPVSPDDFPSLLQLPALLRGRAL